MGDPFERTAREFDPSEELPDVPETAAKDVPEDEGDIGSVQPGIDPDVAHEATDVDA